MTMTLEEAEKIVQAGFYTLQEAARKLGVNNQTIIRWLHSGEYPYMKIGRRIRIPKATMLAILDEKWVDRVEKRGAKKSK